MSNQVDFAQNGNMLVAAITIIMGTGNYSLHIGAFDLGGIGTATFAAILLNLLLNRKSAQPKSVQEPALNESHVISK